jgi:hypothetical protein
LRLKLMSSRMPTMKMASEILSRTIRISFMDDPYSPRFAASVAGEGRSLMCLP